MSNEIINDVGDLLDGKETEKTPKELAVKTRRAKLSRRANENNRALAGTTAADVLSTSDQQDQAQDDVYFDALLRFGIQI